MVLGNGGTDGRGGEEGRGGKGRRAAGILRQSRNSWHFESPEHLRQVLTFGHTALTRVSLPGTRWKTSTSAQEGPRDHTLYPKKGG